VYGQGLTEALMIVVPVMFDGFEVIATEVLVITGDGRLRH
jgi:hypothetical protein